MPAAARLARMVTTINEIFRASTSLLRELVDCHEASHVAIDVASLRDLQPIRLRLSGSGVFNASVKGNSLGCVRIALESAYTCCNR
jgi:hypothetical protein